METSYALPLPVFFVIHIIANPLNSLINVFRRVFDWFFIRKPLISVIIFQKKYPLYFHGVKKTIFTIFCQKTSNPIILL